MILVDHRRGSIELLRAIANLGVPVAKTELQYGDFAFEGNGPRGSMLIGIERKTLHDMLNSIDTARYSGHQKVGMHLMYGQSFLIVEGRWCPGRPPNFANFLLEKYGERWLPCRYRTGKVMYSKLYRYLLSVSLGGVIVLHARDTFECATNIVETYHYFQKKWNDHTSLIECQRVALPQLNGKPSLVRLWANDIEDIGVKFSLEAQRLFKTPIKLAQSDESQWMKIKGIGVSKAQQIIREIWGQK